MDTVASLAPFVLSLWLMTFPAPGSPLPSSKIVFLGQFIDPVFMDSTESFHVVESDLYLASFVP